MELLLGLGGNIGTVRRTLADAARALGQRFRIVAASSLWHTVAVGPPQPSYLNAVLRVEADPDPLSGLAACQHVEARAGRDRGAEQRWGPRVLDVDLLLADSVVAVGPRLTVPHPRFHKRAFALLPAAEIAPGWVHPRLHRSVAELAATVGPTGCERLGPFSF